MQKGNTIRKVQRTGRGEDKQEEEGDWEKNRKTERRTEGKRKEEDSERKTIIGGVPRTAGADAGEVTEEEEEGKEDEEGGGKEEDDNDDDDAEEEDENDDAEEEEDSDDVEKEEEEDSADSKEGEVGNTDEAVTAADASCQSTLLVKDVGIQTAMWYEDCHVLLWD